MLRLWNAYPSKDEVASIKKEELWDQVETVREGKAPEAQTPEDDAPKLGELHVQTSVASHP